MLNMSKLAMCSWTNRHEEVTRCLLIPLTVLTHAVTAAHVDKLETPLALILILVSKTRLLHLVYFMT